MIAKLITQCKNMSASRKQDLVVCALGIALVCIAKLIN